MEDCKAIRMPFDPKTKLKKNENKDVEMVSLSTRCGILDVCHVVYSVEFGIPNKHGESTHGQSKHRTLDYGQVHILILARHFVIQITLQRMSAPRFGRIL